MKKFLIILSIVAAGMLCLGGAFIGIGKMLGGTLSWSVGFGKEGKITENTGKVIEKSGDLDPFDKIVYDGTVLDFKIVEGDKYSYEYKTDEYLEPEIVCENSELKISQKNKGGVEINCVSLDLDTKNYLIITVPSDDKLYEANLSETSGSITSENINIYGSIKSSSGEIDLSGINNDKDISVGISSGDVEIKESTFANFDYDCKSGDLSVDGCVIDDVDLEITSGDVSVANSECTDFRFSALSGNLDINEIDSDSFNVEISSGDVYCAGLTTDKVTFKATSGNIDIELKGKEDEYNYDLSKTSGDISVDGNSIDKKYIKNESDRTKSITGNITSGNVSIDFVD